jgi:hypothetical protein
VHPHSITQNSRMLFAHVEDGGFMEGSTKHLGNAWKGSTRFLPSVTT